MSDEEVERYKQELISRWGYSEEEATRMAEVERERREIAADKETEDAAEEERRDADERRRRESEDAGYEAIREREEAERRAAAERTNNKSFFGSVGGAFEDAGNWIGTALDDGWGWVSGRDERDYQKSIREQNMGLWDELGGTLPSEDSEAARAEAEDYAVNEQRNALDSMRDIDGQLAAQSRGEYSEIDRARQEEMLRRNALQERGQREAALAQMQARGMGQSGTALTSSLMAGQQGANRSSQEGLQIEALAQQRALQAMQARGQLAQGRGSLAGQRATDTFNRKFSTGQAQDRQRQQGFQNRTDIVAGKTDQYDRAGAASRQRLQDDRAAATGIGQIISNIL
jgi:hypothetical protein